MGYNDHMNFQKWWETRYKELIQSTLTEENGKQFPLYLFLSLFSIILIFIHFAASITPGRSKQVQEKPKKRKTIVPPPPPSHKSVRLSIMPTSFKGKNKAEIEVEEIRDEESDNLALGSSKFSSLSSSLSLSLYIIFCKPHFCMK